MKAVFYKIECLTNLHVGSGEVNYNIVDNEVEKDAVTGLPVIHASGVKGALRDALSETYTESEIYKIFGAPGDGEASSGGSHKFLDACLISRPMRVSGSSSTSSIPVVTVDSLNGFLAKASAFGANPFGICKVSALDFGDNEFLTSSHEAIKVENDATGKLGDAALAELSKLESVIGKEFAVVKSFDDYDLPVTARNCLQGKGNLWYEEVVPHGSVLYFAVIYPSSATPELNFPPVVQFGGNASIGCGYTKITKLA
jgi:CRISPR-associated protein Cmr4